MKNQFVTYEIALALKGLGFNEECWFYFSLSTKELMCHSPINERNSTYNHNEVAAPLWQQAIDWLREEKQIDIWFEDWFENKKEYGSHITDKEGYAPYMNNGPVGTYYEAREQAILKAIELVKQQK